MNLWRRLRGNVDRDQQETVRAEAEETHDRESEQKLLEVEEAVRKIEQDREIRRQFLRTLRDSLNDQH